MEGEKEEKEEERTQSRRTKGRESKEVQRKKRRKKRKGSKGEVTMEESSLFPTCPLLGQAMWGPSRKALTAKREKNPYQKLH